MSDVAAVTATAVPSSRANTDTAHQVGGLRGRSESSSSEEQDELAQALEKSLEKKVLRKVDLLLMPILTMTIGLQYYDKAVLNSASLFGIIKDLHLSTTHNGVTSTLRYSTANSAFYWGYIVAVVPFALLLQRFPTAKVLSLCMCVTIVVIVLVHAHEPSATSATHSFLWGVVCVLTVVVKSYEGLVVQRVVLGALESSVSPGFVLITGQWYRKSEQATRLGIWYSATGIFSVFSGVINYGLGSAGGSLAPWKYMYLFAGAWTILWAFVVLYFIPDSPQDSHRWFNEEERRTLLARSRKNRTGAIGPSTFKWSHAREAATDVKLYLYLLISSAIYVCNGGVTAFGARIVNSFGYSPLNTILLLIPGGVFTMVTIYLFTWLAGRWKNSITYLIPISCVPIVVGSFVIWLASWKHRGVPLFGYYLIPCFGAPYVLLLATSTANIAGSTKKAIAAGFIFIGYNVGNIVGPYLVFTPDRVHKYRKTWISLIVCMCVASVLSLALRYVMVRENRERDREAASRGEKEEEKDIWEQGEERDYTDGEDRGLRYTL
ncbi:BZ3500_MvSof-1268-A1-R1_Chr10-1g02709 [Microbotryum saponariae]|uniref:BZ3500_MvSof-1268-A1-R1_Chr10-1g02709 protein n=1 Tax=Microbotryum saponariae TaxID=289078 RepID=A0A2X0LLY9_9BASI|nr:BZ3500_MvSof-1268-A1-R1_Chr10-1g02709 [Microbotryum saponariae]SDA06198.1 BZ3501_MvSof-1269-A2-R1_Chr10-1g02310 [Microbotryum saponariae]